jgi:peptidoglycan/LPS O-acetylase OafA/YrhL
LLDAGRGIAALGVLLFHSTEIYKHSPNPLASLWLATNQGNLGVEVFFAISGWCIAERLAKARRTGESVIHFAVERILRIYPTYWAALAVLLVTRLAASPFNTPSLADSLPHGTRGWLGAALLIEPYLRSHAPAFLVVSWSLTFELGFYLIAVLALAVSPTRLGKTSTLIWGGTLLCVVPWTPLAMLDPVRILGLWPDFFAGVAAWAAVRPGLRARGYAVLVLLLALDGFWCAHGGGVSRLIAIFTAWVLALARPWDFRLARLAVLRPLFWVGGLSYSLYLIHLPLIYPVQNLLGRWVSQKSSWSLLVWMGEIALALAGANGLNRWVEEPVNRWRRKAL